MEERAKFSIGEIVYLECSIAPGLYLIYNISWWDDPAPEIFGKRKLPWYHLRHIVSNETCEEFESSLTRDEGANLLYE